MQYLYLVDQKLEDKKSCAYRLPSQVTLFDVAKAEESGYKWLTEEEAININLQIPNSSGHWGIITKERTWEVPVKVENGAIWCHWLLKWYAIWEYRPKGTTPSAQVMKNVERVFRTNSGLPINHDINFIWQ